MISSNKDQWFLTPQQSRKDNYHHQSNSLSSHRSQFSRNGSYIFSNQPSVDYLVNYSPPKKSSLNQQIKKLEQIDALTYNMLLPQNTHLALRPKKYTNKFDWVDVWEESSIAQIKKWQSLADLQTYGSYQLCKYCQLQTRTWKHFLCCEELKKTAIPTQYQQIEQYFKVMKSQPTDFFRLQEIILDPGQYFININRMDDFDFTCLKKIAEHLILALQVIEKDLEQH